MNGIQCPRCSVVNSTSALDCRQCHFPFGNLSSTAFVTVPESEIFRSQSPNFQANIRADNQTGRKVYFWYRVYCSALVVLYLVAAILGAIAIVGSYGANVEKPEDAFKGGIVLLIFGGVLAVVYLTGVILSPKSATWIWGIVLIALGMISVCLLPFTLPLLLFWLKPATQNYFGR